MNGIDLTAAALTVTIFAIALLFLFWHVRRACESADEYAKPKTCPACGCTRVDHYCAKCGYDADAKVSRDRVAFHPCRQCGTLKRDDSYYHVCPLPARTEDGYFTRSKPPENTYVYPTAHQMKLLTLPAPSASTATPAR